MKKCPFCKNEIESSSTECPICKMVLIEKIPSIQARPNNTYTPPREKKAEQKTYTYPPRKKFSLPKIKFGIPKNARGWIISIAGSILLTIILSSGGNSNPLPAPITTTENNSSQSTLNDLLPQKPYRYLANGTVLFKNQYLFNGEGVLSISNGSGLDAIIKLITNDDRKVYSVYTRANNSYSIKNIEDGKYRVLFAFGADWDSEQKKFLVNPSAQAFDNIFDFETTYDKYTENSITLNPVIGGNATTNPIDISVFEKY